MVKLSVGKYDTLLDTQKSDTIDAVYQIRWDKEKGYHCSCIGWRKGRQCKHIKRFGFKVALASIGIEGHLVSAILKEAKEIWPGVV